jgi:RNA-directed DNA polymerase
MALKLVLEPIFETGFYPSSYAYRPGRRAQDAIDEIHYFTTRTYEWIVERTSRRASTASHTAS